MNKALWIEWMPVWPGSRIKYKVLRCPVWYRFWLAFLAALVLSMARAPAADFTCEQARFWTSHFTAAELEAKAAQFGITITAADRRKAAQCQQPTEFASVARTRGGAAAARPVHTRKVEGASPSPASTPTPVPAPQEHTDVPLPVILPPPDPAPIMLPSPPPTRGKNKMLTIEHWLVLFAVLGAATFSFLVWKHGLVPVAQKATSWWNTAKVDLKSLEARLTYLEAKVGALYNTKTGPAIAAAPAQAAPSPAAPNGASPAAAAPSPTQAA